MGLFALEHKKLWRKTSVRVSVLLCFVYMVVFCGALSYQWFEFGSSNDVTSAFGNNFDGYAMIRSYQASADGYGGYLTDESFQRMVRDIQADDDKGIYRELKDNRSAVNDYLTQLYPELRETDNAYSILMEYYVDSSKLTGFYERRQAAVEEFLHLQGQGTGAEGEMLRAMNEKVEEPFRFGWTSGWQNVLGDTLPDMGVIMALFLAIVLSPTFSGEWHSNTAPLLLTMDRGWRHLALAKILSGLAFAVELFALLAVGSIAAQLVYLGTDGWDMPIQVIKLLAVAPMNMLQAEIFEYAFALLGAIGFAGVVMLLSALVKSNVLALLLSLAAAYGPMMIAQYLPYGLQKALDLIPLVGSGADIFRTNTFHIFGKYIWSPYLLITVPVLIGLACVPFAIMKWSRRQRV